MPVGLAVMIRKLEIRTFPSLLRYKHDITVVFTFVQSAIIAEEKENTLRTVMLSPATTVEILGGKSLLTFIMTVVTVVICTVLTGYQPANLPIIAAAIILSTIFYIALGTLLGLVTKSLMEASIAILPIMFVFGFASVFVALADEYPFLKLLEYFPGVQLEALAEEVENGETFLDVWQPMAIILAWVIGGLFLTFSVYQKRKMDG